MPRVSKSTHPLAIARLSMEMGQREMGELLGVTRHTIQAIELGHLEMSPRLAAKLAAVNGEDVRSHLERKVEEFRQEIYRKAGVPLD